MTSNHQIFWRIKHHAERSALAAKYGWSIMGWAVDLDDPAGITLQSKYDSTKFLRFQHKDSLKKWESELKENTSDALTEKKNLTTELRELLNRHNVENRSNTPDYILAGYLQTCLNAWDTATQERDRWYRVDLRPGRRTGHGL